MKVGETMTGVVELPPVFDGIHAKCDGFLVLEEYT
jgi:hypothetical protein